METLSVSSADCARSDDHVRALLLEALALLDRSEAPEAIKAAAHISHALEILSPGADPFAFGREGGGR